VEEKKEFVLHINSVNCNLINHLWDVQVNARVKSFVLEGNGN